MKYLLPFLFFVLLSGFVNAQPAFRVYYLAIGSEHFEHDTKKFKDKSFIPYDDLPEATNSAHIISSLFSKYANAKGKTLVSTSKSFITRQKVIAHIDTLKKMIAREKPDNPLLVVYYCGHGVSENLSWAQYLVPGNFTPDNDKRSIEELSRSMLYVGTLADLLDQLKIRYILLTDCCRKEEADNSLPEAQLRYFFSNQNVETFKTVQEAFKILNEFRQINPVVFSVEPGKTTPVVDIPGTTILRQLERGDSSIQVGPVCRRILLLIEEFYQSPTKTLTLETFMDRLTNAGLDKYTPASISFYRRQEDNGRNNVLFAK